MPSSEHSRLTAPARYGFAIVLVGVALFLSLALQAPFGNPFWLIFSVAVIASTWYGGKGPGWVSVILSILTAIYYFIPPINKFAVNLRDVPFCLTFVACQLIAGWLVSSQKDAADYLRRTRDELEVRVGQRTAELRAANEALLSEMKQQRRTEEALQVARSELARVVRIATMGELAASIAHEVNQPLAGVVANVDACVSWLSHQSPNLSEALAAAERAAKAATRSSEVIVRIRSLINKATPEKKRVAMNEVIKEAVALANSQAARNNVSVVLELTPDLPAVLGDKIQLEQVVLNLIMNGIDAMSEVTARPRRLLVRTWQQGSNIQVSVQDSGNGIDDQVMPHLFEPFFTTRLQGLGMGLPISRSIIEAHGGKLWVESKVNQGSVFQFTLPDESGVAL